MRNYTDDQVTVLDLEGLPSGVYVGELASVFDNEIAYSWFNK